MEVIADLPEHLRTDAPDVDDVVIQLTPDFMERVLEDARRSLNHPIAKNRIIRHWPSKKRVIKK